jgi:hypothetical protein
MGKLSGQLTDEQLHSILNETGPWAIRGHGKVLGVAASLRHAINRHSEYAGSGATVASLYRLPPSDMIVVLPAQIARLQRELDVHTSAPAPAEDPLRSAIF